MRYYELIDRLTISPAPKPLRIDGQDIFTTDETIYNENGYYRLEREDYPEDEKAYSPYYEMQGNIIKQKWEEVIPDAD